MPTRAPVHRPLGAQSKAEGRTAYDRMRRQRGGDVYNNTRWRKIRAAFLATHPVCVVCQYPATVVDHIKPHRGNDALMWDWNNLQACCKSCHDRKTMTTDRVA